MLLIAAESALVQDPPGQVGVLGWPLGTSMEALAADPEPRQPLRLPQGEAPAITPGPPLEGGRPYRLGRRDQRWRPPEPASSGAPSRRRIATTPGRGAVPAAADGQLEPSGTCLSCSKLPPFRSRRV